MVSTIPMIYLSLMLPAALSRQASKPNIVWFLTDDQDQLLGGSFPTHGATPMPQTQELLQRQGVTADNWYIHTPICSPSRSELLTGRYFHNIKQVGTTGGYCSGMHVNYSLVNNNTFAKVLHEDGYTVGMFGKYLNEMPTSVPPGFDAWLANGGGDYIAPRFMTQNIDGLADGFWQGSMHNYSTAVIGNVSIAWLNKVGKQDKPFMAYIAPKAAHEPFIPAPWHLEHWDQSWPAHEPRPVNWNCSTESRIGHHGNVATEGYITPQASQVITDVFKNRWRTLMSVDDVIAQVVHTVQKLGKIDNTYFFFSSDHGFQLGQFNIPMDKRHVYEWDTKIHLLARGPGIAAGSTFSAIGTQVDLAPTFLGLAGIPAPAGMDGRSVVPFLLTGDLQELPASTVKHLRSLPKQHTTNWRTEAFIEYYFCEPNLKCVQKCNTQTADATSHDQASSITSITGPSPSCAAYPHADVTCGELSQHAQCWSPCCSSNCYATEDTTNNFIALREVGAQKNTLYAEFQTGDLSVKDVDFNSIDFVEYYDLAQDPWQMHNLANKTSASERKKLHKRLHAWLHCSGSSCP